MKTVRVIGAGLAGCEAAWQLANRGVPVKLYEMKPHRMTPAHHTPLFAELVCSNSLKAARIDSAAGLLKEEMRRLGSVCLPAADKASVAAGGALAVDRTVFAEIITEKIKSHPMIEVIEKTVDDFKMDELTVLATGPLTEPVLANRLSELLAQEHLSFFDAAAPIVTAESIDFTKAFYASRYDNGSTEGDYINCPMNKEEYLSFHEALIHAESAPLHDFDQPVTVYEGCMPIEVLAKRGTDSIRFGPMKPIGLKDPRTGHRPWAVVQLRRENAAGTLFNLVGFQTNLKFPEQKRVFCMIPGLENAEIIRYGVMHRNTFINAPKVLSRDLSLKQYPNIFVAGQLSGVEGYMESAASGIMAGINAANRVLGKDPLILPDYTMIGALLSYICCFEGKDFQPMGANFGVLPSLATPIRDKRERYAAFSARSLAWFEGRKHHENCG
ncbi:MAG: methylenetetrahydrofolate--tRNA-(uracil(54)-C(5))-methyltransferase (FADH(2)-oxidizing) TrmFO [Clostridia bacterium]|nr:methylenetetrahydrofolate--tRNA-(uracil(54)-C(5))-methyltransferase (FADH(2)-oxidizing) TrmFO [Clostridia bacterium]